MEFKPYEAKPVTRMAFQISAVHSIKKHENAEASWQVTHPDYPEQIVTFKAYEEPKAHDWVVRLTESDTYHCTDAVFRERNVVPD